jgi:hypothetical protein
LIVAGEDMPAAVAVLLGLTCENETNGMRKTHWETRIGVLPCHLDVAFPYSGKLPGPGIPRTLARLRNESGSIRGVGRRIRRS